MSESVPDVVFRDVAKHFGDNHVLKRFNFTVQQGEKVAIIGPSGSGKTTVLRLLMGLETLTGGEIKVFGSPYRVPDKASKETAKRIGMVFQQFNLFPHMNVLRNITEAPIRVRKMSSTDAEAKAMELLERVGLSEKATAFPRHLSGGQQQRVAIARALAMEPDIMLFDEPTSALDPELVGDVLRTMRDLAKTSNMTMMFVTHEMAFAQHVADTVIFMDEGVVVEAGVPSEVFSAPRKQRTRDFLRSVLDPMGWAEEGRAVYPTLPPDGIVPPLESASGPVRSEA